MKSWAEQVEELGRMGQWTEAIRLLRQSSDGESDLSVGHHSVIVLIGSVARFAHRLISPTDRFTTSALPSPCTIALRISSLRPLNRRLHLA